MQPSHPILRTLRPGDIPDAMELKAAAGWNQTEEDWRLYREIAPEGCFALEVEGKVVATSTAIPYRQAGPEAHARGVSGSAASAPAFGWVGMVLVHPEHRRRGHGTRMLDAATRFLEGRGAVAALDATPQGRPLYASRGFADLCGVQRRVGTARVPRPLTSPRLRRGERTFRVEPLDAGRLEPIRSLDREAFGADRLRVVGGLLARSGSFGLICRFGAGVEGYLIGREGTLFYHVGPWVARSPEAAAALWRSCIQRLDGRSVGVDVFTRDEEARRLAEEAGLAVARPLTRMVRWKGHEAEPPPGGRADRIHALSGFEWG